MRKTQIVTDSFPIPLASFRVFCVCEALDLQIQNVSRTNWSKLFIWFSSFKFLEHRFEIFKIILKSFMNLIQSNVYFFLLKWLKWFKILFQVWFFHFFSLFPTFLFNLFVYCSYKVLFLRSSYEQPTNEIRTKPLLK